MVGVGENYWRVGEGGNEDVQLVGVGEKMAEEGGRIWTILLPNLQIYCV